MTDPATAWLHKVLRYDSEEQTHTGLPTKDDAPVLIDFNPYHEPAGSPEGGRFTSGQGAEGSKKNPEK